MFIMVYIDGSQCVRRGFVLGFVYSTCFVIKNTVVVGDEDAKQNGSTQTAKKPFLRLAHL